MHSRLSPLGLIALLYLLTPSCHHAQQLTVGRFVADGNALRFAWSNSVIRAHFSGTRIAVRLSDAQPDGRHNVYDVNIDDGPPSLLKVQPGQLVYPLAADLPAGEHTVTLVRRTEALIGEARFAGFDVGDGMLLSPPEPRPHRMLVIGDSISAGYGNEGTEPTCPFSEDSENATLTYGALAASALDADAVIIAWSGKGVSRNRDGSTHDTMPVLYDRALPEDANSAWRHGEWVPDAVVINLGTNDFAHTNPDEASFVGAYTSLLKKVRHDAPRAHVVLALGPMLTDRSPKGANQLTHARNYLRHVLLDAASRGDTNVSVLEFPEQTKDGGYGCDYHPNLATHEAMAAHLVEALRGRF